MTVHSFARSKLPRQNMMNDVILFSRVLVLPRDDNTISHTGCNDWPTYNGCNDWLTCNPLKIKNYEG